MTFEFLLSGYQDSNLGPLAPKASTLANCATPRIYTLSSGLELALRSYPR